MVFLHDSKKSKRLFSSNFFLFVLGLIALLWALSHTTFALAADITLAWDANTGSVDGYRVYCREQAEEYNYSQPDWEGSSTTCTIYGLDDSTTYYFVVRTFNEFGESGDSNEAIYSPSSPTISLDRSNLSNSCTEGSNASSQGFEIWNSGGGTLTYSISNDETWLSCNPNSGTSTGEHDNITVDYSTSSLPPGNYSATISITAEGAGNSPQEIEVSLTVNYAVPDPLISLDRSNLSNSCTEGSNASSQGFEIWNSGGGTLTYSISNDETWLSCNPNSGTSTGEHDNITVDYSTSSLPPGNYSATISITAEGAGNSPQGIEVSLGISESNLPPSRPVITSPYPGEGECELLLPITTEPFSDPDGDSHSESRWQVSTENNFSNPSLLVLDLTSSEHLTVLHMPHNVLSPANTYYVRVQFYDSYNEASDWSDTVDFTTAVSNNNFNGDGIPDDQAVDTTVDLNQDGIPDNDQPDVIKSVQSIDGTFNVGVCKVSASISAIETVEMVDPSTISDNTNRPDAFIFGIITYRLRVNQPGDTATVRIYFSENISNTQTYFKYDTINGWQDYWEHTTFNDDGRSITLEIKDGDHGDSDGLTNGIIVDPGALSEEVSGGSAGGSGGSSSGSCFISTATSGFPVKNQSCAHRAFTVTIVSFLTFLFMFFALLLKKKQRRKLG